MCILYCVVVPMSRHARFKGLTVRINCFFSSRRWLVLWALALAFSGLGFAGPRGQPKGRPCLQAARRWLGASAEVVKCGHLTEPGSFEVVAILPLSGHKKIPGLYYASKFIILRRTGPGLWTVELRADQLPPRNSSGYVGIEVLSNCPSYGYALEFSHHIVADDPSNVFNNRPYFTVSLTYLNPDGHMEGSETEISWNPKVRRFQEFDYEAGRFKREVKKPPYLKLCGPSAHGSPGAGSIKGDVKRVATLSAFLSVGY